MTFDNTLWEDEHTASIEHLVSRTEIPPQPTLDSGPPPTPKRFELTPEECEAGLEQVARMRELIEQTKAEQRSSWKHQREEPEQ